MSNQDKKTMDCSKVWDLIRKVIDLDKSLGNELSDVFCDWECDWKEHADEYHK